MTTLYIDRRNLTLRADGDSLVCYENGERTATVPLKVLQCVCIRGDLTLSAKVLGKLGEADIGVLVLNGRLKRPALMLPNLKLDGSRRVAQYAFSQDKAACLAAARNTVSAKLSTQQQHLQQMMPSDGIAADSLNKHIKAISRLADTVPDCNGIARLRGIEGAAAAQYFGAWAAVLPETLHFTGRNRRPPRDPVNAALSLTYTLMHFEIVKHLHLSGLDPFIGYYHLPEHGRESLACDWTEHLRCRCDEWVLSLFARQILTPSDFSTNPQGCLMGKNARIKFYPAYEQAAKSWRGRIHQLCAGHLANLAEYSGQPEIRLGALKVWE